jgi:uncharacterized protein DUF4037
MPARFVPGRELADGYFTDVVRPLLDAAYPRLRYAAALLGWGSDVLGYDTIRSTDHNWGPRLLVLLADGGPAGDAGGPAAGDGAAGEENIAGRASGKLAAAISAMLGRRLPAEFRGYPTVFADVTRPGAPPRHWVEVAGLRSWLTGQLGFDPTRPVTTADWLATPTQRLAEVTGGAVYHDGPGELTRARDRLAWYPRDVWLHVLACQWGRIGQEEAFPGRCAEVGDGLGSAVVTARLARDLMRLCLLMRRRYPPYSKWLGTAFARLPEAAALVPLLTGAVTAAGWDARERQLGQAYEAVAALHNALGLTEPLDPGTRPYFGRPFQVIDAGRFAGALREAIRDPRIRRLPAAGAVDQFIDSTDALGDTGLLRAASAAVMNAG